MAILKLTHKVRITAEKMVNRKTKREHSIQYLLERSKIAAASNWTYHAHYRRDFEIQAALPTAAAAAGLMIAGECTLILSTAHKSPKKMQTHTHSQINEANNIKRYLVGGKNFERKARKHKMSEKMSKGAKSKHQRSIESYRVKRRK